MVNRREFLGTTLGAGATLAFTPELLRALQLQQPGGKLIQRAIPSSGEMLPVIGLHRGNVPADPAALKEVLKTLVDNGGRVVDTVHGGPPAEQVAGTIANELGIQNKIFWSTKVTAPNAPKADPAAAKAQIEASFARLKAPMIGLMQVSVLADVPTYLAVLREMKKEGRVRYIGVTAAFSGQHTELASVMRSEPIDFVSIDYAVDNRNVEQTILPLAQERKIGVVSCFPFGGNSGPGNTVINRLFQRAGTTPLPEWAAEFDAKTWAQFFLKYVISHPAVTVARVGTEKAKHLLDNIGGGIGRLPNESTRKRMAEFIDALPGAPVVVAQGPTVAVPAALLDRYVGEYTMPGGGTWTFRRVDAALLLKPGKMDEALLVARSETRFTDARGTGPNMEFQLDSAGTVTGLWLEVGGGRMLLTRVR